MLWHLDVKGHPQMLPLLYEDVMRDSMEVWSRVDQAEFVFVDAGYRVTSMTGYDLVNSLYVVESGWTHGPEIIALTTTQYFDDGEVVDADMAFNAQDFSWTPNTDGIVETDLMSIAVHEMGHAAGLCHTSERWATMYAQYNAGETHQRDLHGDDIAGVAELYPCPGGTSCSAGAGNIVGVGCQSGTAIGGIHRQISGVILLLGVICFLGRPMRMRFVSWLGMAGICVLVTGQASATTFSIADFASLAVQSSDIVRVTVEDVRAYEETTTGLIRSQARVVVEEVLRGTLARSQVVVLDYVGGHLDGRGTRVDGGLHLKQGGHHVLFLTNESEIRTPLGDIVTADEAVRDRRVVGMDLGAWIATWSPASTILVVPSPTALRIFSKTEVELLPSTIDELRTRILPHPRP